MKCAGCLKNTKDVNHIKCTLSECGKVFCSLCINLNVITSERKKLWKCPDCCAIVKKGDNSLTPVRATNEMTNVTTRKKPEIIIDSSRLEIKELIAEVRLLTTEITSLKQKFEEATTSLTRCQERLEELRVVTTSNDKRIKYLENRTQEIPLLQASVQQLKMELNIQEQNHLGNEIELSGIPEQQNENLHHIVLLAARKIGVELDDSDLDWVSRAGTRDRVKTTMQSSKFPRPVVARLLRRTKRDEILRSAKSRKNIMSKDLDIHGESLRIYCNERLTKENRLLFRDARKHAKQHGYAFCWCNRGSIYIRQREGKAAIPIRSREDINNVFGPPSTESDKS